jgi:trimeric autotransporter adhesin
MSLMKKLPLVLLSTALALSMVACSDPTPPPVVEPTTASLNLTLNGVPAAPVKVLNAAGDIKFDGTVTGSKTIADLPRDKYTVTGGAVSNLIAPAPQTADLSAGNGTVTLNYLASPVSTTADLTVAVTGVPAAPVKITDAAGAVKFDGPVTGSKTLSALPRGKYTVTGGAVADFAPPATQTADLSAGNGAATLNYLALAGQAVVLDKIQGTLSDPLAKGNRMGVLLSDRSVLSMATVSMDGTISLPLLVPPTSELSPFLPSAGSSCTYIGTSTGNSGGVFAANPVLYSAQGDLIGNVYETPVGTVGSVFLVRLYSATSQSYQGTVTCSTPAFSNRFNVLLVAGWNALLYSVDPQGNVGISSAPADTRVQLNLDKRTEAVYIQLSTKALALKAGESTTIDADFFQTGGISGKIDLSTNVPGVTVEPATITLAPLGTQSLRQRSVLDAVHLNVPGMHALGLGAQRLTTKLTIKAAADAGAFNNTMFVIAKQGVNEVGRVGVSLNLSAPGVQASIENSYTGLNVAQGETASLNVRLDSVGDFSGPVIISLAGLPSGVTSVSKTVQVAPGVSQGISLPLTADVAAELGQFKLTLITDKKNYLGYASEITLNVQPSRVVVAAQNTKLLTAGEGIWVIGSETYDSTIQKYVIPVSRLVNGISKTTLQTDGGFSFLSSPIGELIGFKSVYDSATGQSSGLVRTFHDDGTINDVKTEQEIGYAKGYYSSPEATVDNQGNIWFVGNNNFYKYTNDGKITQLDSGHSYVGIQHLINISDDGKFIFIRTSQYDNSSDLVRINVAGGVTEHLGAAPNGFSASVIANDGVIWGVLGNEGKLTRMNTDGSTTSYTTFSVNKIIGFDKLSQNVIWTYYGGTISKITLSTQTSKNVNFGSIWTNDGVITLGGGMDFVYSYYSGVSSTYYLSHLK